MKKINTKLLNFSLLALWLTSCTPLNQHYLLFPNLYTGNDVSIRIKSGVSSVNADINRRKIAAKNDFFPTALYAELQTCNPNQKIWMSENETFIYLLFDEDFYCIKHDGTSTDKKRYYTTTHAVKPVYSETTDTSLFYLAIPYHLVEDRSLRNFDSGILLGHGYFYTHDMESLKTFYQEWTSYRIRDISPSEILLSQGEDHIYIRLRKSGMLQEICFSLE